MRALLVNPDETGSHSAHGINGSQSRTSIGGCLLGGAADDAARGLLRAFDGCRAPVIRATRRAR